MATIISETMIVLQSEKWKLQNEDEITITRMWANAQRDSRPAEHRWRPLFKAAKFGWRSLLDAVQ